MKKNLVIGTRNRKKLVELRDLLADLPLQLHDLSAFPQAPEIEETADSFRGNARLKGIGIAQAIGEWVLADDSGLCVPALNGAPGLYSARYAGTHGDDAANNSKLLRELGNRPFEERSAYYVCVAVLVNPNGEVVAEAEGRCSGRIVFEPRGTGGFGYDPLFLIPEFHRTFGELSLLVKQVLSHRARAVNALRSALWRII